MAMGVATTLVASMITAVAIHGLFPSRASTNIPNTQTTTMDTALMYTTIDQQRSSYDEQYLQYIILAAIPNKSSLVAACSLQLARGISKIRRKEVV